MRKFRVVGIETSAGLAPDDPNAFVTGLSFVADGTVQMTQTSMAVEAPVVPEAQTWALLAMGLFALAIRRRNVQRSSF